MPRRKPSAWLLEESYAINTHHIQTKLESIDCNLPKGLARQNNRSLVTEIEKMAIDFGEERGLTDGGAMSPLDEVTLPDVVFDDLLATLRRLRVSITPKECFCRRRLVLALLEAGLCTCSALPLSRT